jgi:predicted acetyltransferase
VLDEQVTIERATPADATLLANLLELYIHDLSEVFSIEPGPDGRFGYPKLSLYWSEPEKRFPFLIRTGGKALGFALVTRGSPASDDPDVLDIAEFFVLRSHRRTGCGRRAAALLFDRFPGRWIVRISEGNRGAIPFWESVISTYTRGKFTQSTREASPHAWRDLSFVSSASGCEPDR